MAAVCAACGVPVVPGYVRCPKCHKPLPTPRKQSATRDPSGSGTAVERAGGIPVVAIVAAVVVVGGIIAIFALRDRGGGTKSPEVVAPVQAVEPAERGSTPVTPSADPTESAPRAPDPTQAGVNLELALRHKRLWSTVEITAGRVEVRSSSCADPGFGPVIEAARAALRGAGLTKLRCVEESGHVAFERDL